MATASDDYVVLPVRLLEGQAASERAAKALGAYYAELDERLEGGFRPELVEDVPAHEVTPPHGDFLLVTEVGSGTVLGCGGVRLQSVESASESTPEPTQGSTESTAECVAELQRMWLVPDVRGQGLGRFLLRSLENRARALGATRVVLSLNRELEEAMALYRAAGYQPVGPFEENPYVDVFLGKEL